MNISVSHTVASIENLGSGITYCVKSLSAAQARQGLPTAMFSVGTHRPASFTPFDDQRYSRDFDGVPVLRRLGASRAMRHALNAAKPEVVHTHGLWMLPNTYQPKGSALVISPHGMLTPLALSYSRRKKALFRFLFQDRALSAAALFYATADSEYEDIRRFGLRQPVAIIPNGIDIPGIKEAADISSRREVLSLGRIHKKKGLVSLIRAWAGVCDEFPDWKLRIVGPDEGGHVLELKALIKDLALQSVTIEQPVFGDEKTKLMSSVDLFVLSTLSENFAMTVAESLAVGVPVISTKGAPWAKLETNKCGWWIDHGPEALTVTLRTALALPTERRRQMGARGRDWMIRDFSWNQIAADMITTYEWVKSGGTPPPQVWRD
jgi:glycosyltransferase involved in cell wall biosynthesis